MVSSCGYVGSQQCKCGNGEVVKSCNILTASTKFALFPDESIRELFWWFILIYYST